LGYAIKKKDRKVAKSMPNGSKLPKQLSDTPSPVSRHCYTSEELDEVVAGTEKSICDTHAWQDMVRRVGLKEARKILRLGLLSSQLPDSNPQN
jgi:hypothetical protein